MPNTFQAALDRVRRWRRAGRFSAALLGLCAVAAAVTLLAGLADAFAGFESAARLTLVAAALVLLGLLLLVALGGSLRFSRPHAARLADRLLASPRRPATAGLALKQSDTPLSQFLADRSLESSTDAVNALPAGRLVPWRPLGIAAAALLVALLPLGALRLARPEAFQTIAHRLLHPGADLPPWSPLKFALDPASPAVVYAGDLPLAVELSGATPEFPVECLVRRPGSGEILRLPAFRESSTRFSRTLEGVTEPVSVAFTCGRARSGWHHVELLLQPKVLAGKVTITPPAYTRRIARESPLDSNEIAAIEGSEIILELQSNRPLARSALVFTPAAEPGTEPVPVEIPGETVDTDRITWTWTASRPGTVSATLRDVRGTPAAAPLELNLRAVPDQAPAVDLSSPPRLLLATPSSKVPLNGRAEDDHGLSKIQLVRTLQGFRDRARVVAPALQQKLFDFRDSLDLGKIGVEPGQTLEFFLEASDHNPSLLGQGASEISRIHVISEEQYAERIRAKTTIEQFAARYREIARALEEARRALEEMDRQAAPQDAKQAAAHAKAQAAHQRARDLLRKLADDFPAFEIEKRLKDLAAEGADTMQKNIDDLKNFDLGAPEEAQKQAIAGMLERLHKRKPGFDQLQKDAELIRKAGTLLEMAARFQAIYQSQESIAKRFDQVHREIAKGNDQNRRLLPSLAGTQQKNREALDAFATELKKRAEALDEPALAPLRDSALAFVDALAMSDPGSVMDLASEAGRNGRAGDAYANAELARALLERLMQKPNDAFCQACQGRCMKFSVPHPDVQQTMRQLLEGLLCQNPGMSPNQGQGAGGGFGMGGSGPSGNAQPGYAMSDLPVIGPDRMIFEPPSLGQSGSNEGGGSGRRAAPSTASESSTLSPIDNPREARAAPSPESIPADYRDAVKRYFTPESTKP